MAPVLYVMIVILALAVATFVLVAIGIEGIGRRRAPKVVAAVAKAARHLNGDGTVPRMLTRTH